MEAISRSCLPEAAARTKRQRKATCCGVLGAASHRTTCSRSSAAKLTSGLILAMRTHISYWPQYVYLFMIHTTSELARRTVARAVGSHAGDGNRARGQALRDCRRFLASAARSTTAAGATEQSGERTQTAGGGPAQKGEPAEIG